MTERKIAQRCSGALRSSAQQSAWKQLLIAGACLLGFAPSHAAFAQSVADQVGLTALIQRLGPGNEPTGAGVGVGQVEADSDGVAGPPTVAYPDVNDAELTGKSFTPMSGASGTSGHATFVGRNFYGSNSIAPGVTNIFTYEVNSWLQSAYLFAGFGSGTPPAMPPAGVRVFNNSWIGSAGGFDNEILRRADFAIDRDDVLHVNGVNNGGGQQPLMTFGYNGLAVGMTSGAHTSGNTTAAADGAGRQKPEIVAPGSATSWAAPVVAAAAALMYQTAQTAPLAANSNARRSETIKAALLAGANHRAGWSNNPATSGTSRGITATPLDVVYGVDVVNVDRSHRILTGAEQNGSAVVPVLPNASAAGWDFATMNANTTLNWRFRLHQAAESVSILATWHRTVASNFSSFTLANFDLTLKRVDASGNAVSLTGDAGLPFFASGNVVSQSAVDNIEHIYVRDLAAGDYVIELRRLSDGVPGSRDVAIGWIMPLTLRPGDINGDGVVNVTDLLLVIAGWGTCPQPANCPADTNGDGVVNVTDLLVVIGNWG